MRLFECASDNSGRMPPQIAPQQIERENIKNHHADKQLKMAGV
jgi:hypothetical protein